MNDMTGYRILNKATDKAEKNGWDYAGFDEKHGVVATEYHDCCVIFSHDFAKAFWGDGLICNACGNQTAQTGVTQIGRPDDEMIGGMSVASAGVGSLTYKQEINCLNCGMDMTTSFSPHRPALNAWQWHLSNMVLAKEPLKYLEKFLDKE